MNRITFFLEQNKQLITIIHDMCMILFSICIAYLFRFNFNINFNSGSLLNFLYSSLPIAFFELIIFSLVGVYKSSWRYISISDLLIICKGAILSFIFIYMYDNFIDSDILLSVYFLQLFLLIFLYCISRICVRLYFESIPSNNSSSSSPKRTLIIGTERDSVNIAKLLLKNSQFELIGFLTGDISSNNREIFGIKILGNLKSLKQICSKNSINSILLPSTFADYASRSYILKLSASLNLELLSIPSIDDVIKGKFKLSHFENFSVDDLLGRKPAQLDLDSISNFLGSEIILITGAGGSIGSQIFRDAILFKPKLIICLDN